MRNQKSPSLILTAFILLLSLTLTLNHTKSEVITLTPDTFSDKVKEKDTAWLGLILDVFVNVICVLTTMTMEFSKNLGTLWEDLGKAMEGDDEIEVGEVDCGASKSVCSKADIHSYPTFKVFYDGEEVAKYQGRRDVESLKTFVLEEAEKAAMKAEVDSDKEL
ncbi:hypothetical protein Pint_32219 [Pistacia integerrima]|uniref:Uncharacterized protein n=1 Tax=Pistacia integerrima TaxID=434235 RepID=A0ACC0XP96_9ROSI|nr:hypothetical protein Pint_32219 [Pistacia integerrima]